MESTSLWIVLVLIFFVAIVLAAVLALFLWTLRSLQSSAQQAQMFHVKQLDQQRADYNSWQASQLTAQATLQQSERLFLKDLLDQSASGMSSSLTTTSILVEKLSTLLVSRDPIAYSQLTANTRVDQAQPDDGKPYTAVDDTALAEAAKVLEGLGVKISDDLYGTTGPWSDAEAS